MKPKLFFCIFVVFVAMVTLVAVGEEAKSSCGTIKGVRSRSRRPVNFRHGATFSVARFCGGRIFRPKRGLPSSVFCMDGKWYNQGQTYDVNAIIGNSKYPCEIIKCQVPKPWFSVFEGLSKAYRPGTVLQIKCSPGQTASKLYRQLGGKILCLRGGKWNTGRLPLGALCEATTCKWPPPKKPNVRFTYPDSRDKSNLKATYICAKSHGVKYGNKWDYNLKISCDHTTGKWRESNLQCQALRCQLTSKDLGKATVTSNGTMAHVRCKAPFIYPDGRTTERFYPCKWIRRGRVGFQIPQDVCLHCRELPKISKHTKYVLSNRNTRMDYRCEPGYEFYDARKKRIALCTVYKGRQGWIPKKLVPCEAFDPVCRGMPKVDHAIGEREKLVTTFTCDKGYHFPDGSSKKSVRCNPYSGWPAVTSCIKSQPRSPAREEAPGTESSPAESSSANVYNYF